MIDKDTSFSKINYVLRPCKQVERKIIIDVLKNCREIDIKDYCYIGMGSIAYYDFILVHKLLGIKRLISIDNSTAIKRFEFNKPYEFIDFNPILSSEYLEIHNWGDKKNFLWLDYDSSFTGTDCLETDVSLVCQNAQDKDIFVVTVNASMDKKIDTKTFFNTYNGYISDELKANKYYSVHLYRYLIQNIIMNKFKEKMLYSGLKFVKLFSFHYKDGAPMYTLGGIFCSKSFNDSDALTYHNIVNTDESHIHKIDLPQITYKEKYYLDSRLDSIRRWLQEYETELLALTDDEAKDQKVQEILSKLHDKLDTTLTPNELKNYLDYYLYIPQYYEGII